MVGLIGYSGGSPLDQRITYAPAQPNCREGSLTTQRVQHNDKDRVFYHLILVARHSITAFFKLNSDFTFVQMSAKLSPVVRIKLFNCEECSPIAENANLYRPFSSLEGEVWMQSPKEININSVHMSLQGRTQRSEIHACEHSNLVGQDLNLLASWIVLHPFTMLLNINLQRGLV